MAKPLGKTTFGTTVWDGAKPLSHLTWDGPGAPVKLRMGAVEIGGEQFLGSDHGAIPGAVCHTLAEAQAIVDQFLAGATTRAAFYADKSARARSEEVDLGVWWRSGGRDWPTWSLHYIRDTGEIYAVCDAYGGPVRVLGTVPADDSDAPGGWYATVDKILDGYDPEVTHWDLAWVSRQLAAHAKS